MLGPYTVPKHQRDMFFFFLSGIFSFWLVSSPSIDTFGTEKEHNTGGELRQTTGSIADVTAALPRSLFPF